MQWRVLVARTYDDNEQDNGNDDAYNEVSRAEAIVTRFANLQRHACQYTYERNMHHHSNMLPWGHKWRRLAGKALRNI